ncbi:fimbrial protein [Ursidibacter sp. B-7004-1]
MKKLLVALSVASLFSANIVANGHEATIEEGSDHTLATQDVAGKVSIGSGSISLNGKLHANTCQLVNDDKNKQVTLPSLYVAEFNEGQTGRTPFSINLTDCSIDNTSVILQLKPIQDSVQGPYLKNTTENGSNVGFKLTGDSGRNLDLSTNPTLEQVVEKDKIKFDLYAEYISLTRDPVTPGNVSATLPFVVSYK